MFRKLSQLFKGNNKKMTSNHKTQREIDQDLFAQLDKFRDDTKSLNYLRDELANVSKNKTDKEMLESLAKAFQDDKQKKAK